MHSEVISAAERPEFARPAHIFRFEAQASSAVDRAFAASRGQAIRPQSSLQRLPNGQTVQLTMPQLVGTDSALGPSSEAPTASVFSDFPDADLLADLELEIYLRTDEERIIDLLDFSEISEEADEDGYVVGYVALAHLIRHHDTLRKYGVFLLRTGPLRIVSAEIQSISTASAA
ncbi:hypothetical protein [Hymenobacter psychrotolerans]|uniref:Homoserine dehydrogenase n=1 Tax=Hymenobacter psychrotolerans DSM 18569 TaxID=1121959 RepID=A0A1M6NTI0_9BACT|nr:hypothetical protein [Hymenobacter psychrotolerans]SHJ99026.1 homoserine dehydrogenase [Hymenobacter psychrotolerans DSM 18569]